jgi:glycosyltransferase involved in cell wall biosynthesis
LSSSVPHIITIHDLNFEHNPKDLPWLVSRYFRFFFPKFARKAKKIITVSEYSKEDICTTYGIKKEKVEVIYNAANTAFRQLTEQEICDTKNEFTAGNDFFIFVGSLHPRKNIQNLIYAFELFCVSNKSIKLVIVGSDMWKENNLVISDEVRKQLIFTGHIENTQLTKLMGSALALTYIPYFEGFGIPLVEAMNCGIPIIAANTTCLPEIAKDAAIYCNPFDVNDIAEKMLLVNSNSIIREDLATKSLQRSKYFDWDIAAVKVEIEIKKIVETLPK